MAIDKLIPDHKVSIPDDNSFLEACRWLDRQDLKITRDFVYAGHKSDRIYFGFKDPSAAMLFKLTWGGE